MHIGIHRAADVPGSDHTMFREGLAGMLGSAYGDEAEVVGKTKIGEEAIDLAREKKPDVIIMQVDRTLKKAEEP